MPPKNSKSHRFIRIALLIILTAIILFSAIAHILVNRAARGRIYRDISMIPKCHVALVLGAKVRPNGRLSLALARRCDAAIDLYKAGKADKLLMSGDNRFIHYNEPERMRDYAVEHGVPAEDIVLDYAGRRTYDSIYRAKHIFDIEKMIIVSQSYHLARAIFLADAIGVDVYGMRAREVIDIRSHIREIPARMSAVLDVYVFTPKPVLGKKEKI